MEGYFLESQRKKAGTPIGDANHEAADLREIVSMVINTVTPVISKSKGPVYSFDKPCFRYKEIKINAISTRGN